MDKQPSKGTIGEFEVRTCPQCGKLRKVMFSNNPLTTPICFSCIKSVLEEGNVQHLAVFCRTFNVPIDVTYFLELSENEKGNVYKLYAEFCLEQKDVEYKEDLDFLWRKSTEEWELVTTNNELINKIKPIKKGFMARGHLKWGNKYTFDELINLENLYIETLKVNNANSPMDVENIKKTCRLSVDIDKAIEIGDIDAMDKLTKVYDKLMSLAKINGDMVEEGNGTIRTVADLAAAVEGAGYQFKFYDGVDRDIIDKTLKSIQDYNRELFSSSKTVTEMYQTLQENYNSEIGEVAEFKAREENSLEDLNAANLADLDEIEEAKRETMTIDTEEFEEEADSALDLDDLFGGGF